jgi:hypothetical protein
LEIQARDTGSNLQFNLGDASLFQVSVTGSAGWALEGRSDQVVFGTPLFLPASITANDWAQLCAACGSAAAGATAITTSTDLTASLSEGDVVVLENERFTVRVDGSLSLSPVVVPLATARGGVAVTGRPVFKAGPKTGSYAFGLRRSPKARSRSRFSCRPCARCRR